MTARMRRTVGVLVFTGLGLLALGLTGAKFYQATRQTRTLQHALASTLGWAHAAPRLEEAWARGDPHRNALMNSTPTLWALQRLQQALAQASVRVLQVEPLGPPPAPATHHPPEAATLMKAAVSGTPQALVSFLQTLPQWLPGVTVEHLELVAQSQGLECRLELLVPPPPTGARP